MRQKSGKKIIYYAVIFLFCVFLFFTNDFGLVDIRKTAIITAVGIDKAEAGYKVSALVAVPKPSAEQKSTSETVISGEGETVAFALSEIADKTGWVPKLVFCRTVILGGDVVTSDVMAVLDYFLRDEYMNDNCMVACSASSAEDILSAKPSAESLASVALSAVLGGEANQSGKAAVMNLKDFSVGYYGETSSGYMPVIEVSSSGGSGESGEEGASSEENSGDGIYRTTSTAMFVGGVAVGYLDAEETFMLNVFKTKLRYAVFNAEAEGKTYSLALRRNSGRIRLEINSTAPKLYIKVKAAASVADADFSDGVKDLARSSLVPSSVKAAAKEKMEDILSRIFIKCKESGCDLFLVVDKLKKFENKYYEAYKNDVLNICVPYFTVEIV